MSDWIGGVVMMLGLSTAMIYLVFAATHEEIELDQYRTIAQWSKQTPELLTTVNKFMEKGYIDATDYSAIKQLNGRLSFNTHTH